MICCLSQLGKFVVWKLDARRRLEGTFCGTFILIVAKRRVR